jgi:hypothetical protein
VHILQVLGATYYLTCTICTIVHVAIFVDIKSARRSTTTEFDRMLYDFAVPTNNLYGWSRGYVIDISL